jgi:hypothetical protein
MKSVQLHPLSLLAGVAFAFVIFLAMGQMQMTEAPDLVRVAFASPLAVEPTADQMVMVNEGQPYAVPTGKTFVATGVGLRDKIPSGAWVDVIVDGTQVFSELVANQSGGATGKSTVSLPPGITVASGSTIDLAGQTGTGAVGFLVGYLAD